MKDNKNPEQGVKTYKDLAEFVLSKNPTTSFGGGSTLSAKATEVFESLSTTTEAPGKGYETFEVAGTTYYYNAPAKQLLVQINPLKATDETKALNEKKYQKDLEEVNAKYQPEFQELNKEIKKRREEIKLKYDAQMPIPLTKKEEKDQYLVKKRNSEIEKIKKAREDELKKANAEYDKKIRNLNEKYDIDSLTDPPAIMKGDTLITKGAYRASKPSTVVFLANTDGTRALSAFSLSDGKLNEESCIFGNFLRTSAKEDIRMNTVGGSLIDAQQKINTTVSNFESWKGNKAKYNPGKIVKNKLGVELYQEGAPGLTGDSFINRANTATQDAYIKTSNKVRVNFSGIEMPDLTFNSDLYIKTKLEAKEIELKAKLNLDTSGLNDIKIQDDVKEQKYKDIEIKPLYDELQKIKEDLNNLTTENARILLVFKAETLSIRKTAQESERKEKGLVKKLIGKNACNNSLIKAKTLLDDNDKELKKAEEKLKKATEAYEKACKLKAENFIEGSIKSDKLDPEEKDRLKEQLIKDYKEGKLGESQNDNGKVFQSKEITNSDEVNTAKSELIKEKNSIEELTKAWQQEYEDLKKQLKQEYDEEIRKMSRQNKRFTQQGFTQQEVDNKKEELQQEAEKKLQEKEDEIKKTFNKQIEDLKKLAENKNDQITNEFNTKIKTIEDNHKEKTTNITEAAEVIAKNQITESLKEPELVHPEILEIDISIKTNVSLTHVRLTGGVTAGDTYDINISPTYAKLLEARKHVENLELKNNQYNTKYESQIAAAENIIKNAQNNDETGKDRNAEVAVNLNDESYKKNKQTEDAKKENNEKELKEAKEILAKIEADYQIACDLKAKNFIANSYNPENIKEEALIAAYKEGKLGEDGYPGDYKFISTKESLQKEIDELTKEVKKNYDSIKQEVTNIETELYKSKREFADQMEKEIRKKIKALREEEIITKLPELKKDYISKIDEGIKQRNEEAEKKIKALKTKADNLFNEFENKVDQKNVEIRREAPIFAKRVQDNTKLQEDTQQNLEEVKKKEVKELNINPPSVKETQIVYSTQDISINELHKLYHKSIEELDKLKNEKDTKLTAFTKEVENAKTKEKELPKDTKLPESVLDGIQKDADAAFKRIQDNNEILKLAEEKANNIKDAYKKACELKAKNYFENSKNVDKTVSETDIADAYFKTPAAENPDSYIYQFQAKEITMGDVARQKEIDLTKTLTAQQVSDLKLAAAQEVGRLINSNKTDNETIGQNKQTAQDNLDKGESVSGNDKTAETFKDRGLKQMSMNEMNISLSTDILNEVPDFANNLQTALTKLETANENYKKAASEQKTATQIYEDALGRLKDITEAGEANFDPEEVATLKDDIAKMQKIEEANKIAVEAYQKKLEEAKGVMDTAIEQYNSNSSYYQGVNQIEDRFSKDDVPVTERTAEANPSSDVADLNASITDIDEPDLNTSVDLNDENLQAPTKKGSSLEDRITRFKADNTFQLKDLTRAKDGTCTFISVDECAKVNTGNAEIKGKIDTFAQENKTIGKGDFTSPSPILKAEIELVVETPKKSIQSYEKSTGFRIAIVGDPGDIDTTKYSLNSETGLMEDKSGNPLSKYSEFGGKSPISAKAAATYNKSFNPCMLENASAVAHVNTKPIGKGSPKNMHSVCRKFIPNGTEGSMILGNAKTGFLEIKSNADVAMDQLTIITKDGRRIDLFNTNPIKGVSQSREFHKAFYNNSSLNSDKNSEAVYFNAIDPETKEKVRLCVNPQGFYHVNEDGGINRNRKISYQEMDRFREATQEYAKEIDCDIYSDKPKTVEKTRIAEMDTTINAIKESKEAIDKGEVLWHKFAKDSVAVKIDPKDTSVNQVTVKTPDGNKTDLFDESSPTPSQKFLDEFKKIPQADREDFTFNAAHPEAKEAKVKIKLTKEGEFKALDGKGGEVLLEPKEMDEIIKATIERAKEKECSALDGGKAAALAAAAQNIVVGTTNPPSPTAPTPSTAPQSEVVVGTIPPVTEAIKKKDAPSTAATPVIETPSTSIKSTAEVDTKKSTQPEVVVGTQPPATEADKSKQSTTEVDKKKSAQPEVVGTQPPAPEADKSKQSTTEVDTKKSAQPEVVVTQPPATEADKKKSTQPEVVVTQPPTPIPAFKPEPANPAQQPSEKKSTVEELATQIATKHKLGDTVKLTAAQQQAAENTNSNQQTRG